MSCNKALLYNYYFDYRIYETDDYDINWTTAQCVMCLRNIGMKPLRMEIRFNDGSRLCLLTLFRVTLCLFIAIGFDYMDSTSKGKKDKKGNDVLTSDQLRNYVDEAPDMLVYCHICVVVVVMVVDFFRLAPFLTLIGLSVLGNDELQLVLPSCSYWTTNYSSPLPWFRQRPRPRHRESPNPSLSCLAWLACIFHWYVNERSWCLCHTGKKSVTNREMWCYS